MENNIGRVKGKEHIGNTETMRQHKKLFSRLRIQVTLLVLLGVIPILLLLVFIGVEQRNASMRMLVENERQLVRLAAGRQQRLLEQARALLATVAYLPQIKNLPSVACDDFLSTLLQRYDRYLNFGVIGANGEVLCSALPLDGPVWLQDRPYFQRALQSQGHAVGDFQIGRITGEQSINFGYPVDITRNGEPSRGVIFSALGLNWLNDFQRDVALHEQRTLLIVDGNGTLIAVEPKAFATVGGSINGTPLMQAILQKDFDDTVQVDDPDGMRRLYVFAPVADTGNGSLYVAIGMPVSMVFEEAQRLLLRNLLLLALVTFIILAATMLYAKGVILRPVDALVRAAKRLAGGDLSARADADSHAGEIGELARSFDEMARALTLELEKRQLAAKRLQDAYAELQETYQQLVQAEKLGSIGQTAAAVVHELKNPLGIGLQGIAYLDKASLSDFEANRKDVLQMMREAMHRADAIIKGLLDLSRPAPLNPERTALNGLIREALGSLDREGFLQNIEVVQDLNAEETEIHLDKEQIRQVLINILINAVHAMPEGGSLIVRTRLEKASGDKLKDVSGENVDLSGNVMVCEIADTGTGIPKESLARVFDPFYSTKPKGKGTGLGLAVAHTIMRAHRGTVQVESQVGVGTTFRLLLPADGSCLRSN